MTEPKITDAPSVIHLVYGEIDKDTMHSDCQDVTWSKIPMYDSDVKYIRADIAEKLYSALAAFSSYFWYVDLPSGLDEEMNTAQSLYEEATK